MTVAVVIQCRLGSRRLPRKTLLPLGKTTVVAEVIRRSASIDGVDVVCCAIPEEERQSDLVVECSKFDVEVVFGPTEDVLSRYVIAANFLQATTIIRITSDKPLIDPAICSKVLAMHKESDSEFACNNMPAGWPHGLDCEIFSNELLNRAHDEACDAQLREHVTPWMRNNPDIAKSRLLGPGGEQVDWRLTIDYEEDYRFISSLFKRLPPPPSIPEYSQIYEIIRTEPSLLLLNKKWNEISRYIDD